MFWGMINMLSILGVRSVPKRRTFKRVDLVTQQVRKVLSDTNQSLILMVRG